MGQRKGNPQYEFLGSDYAIGDTAGRKWKSSFRQGRVIRTKAGGVFASLQALSRRSMPGVPLQVIYGMTSSLSCFKLRSASATPPKSPWPCWSASSRPPPTPATWPSTRSVAAAPPSRPRKSWAPLDRHRHHPPVHLAAQVPPRRHVPRPEVPGHRRAGGPGSARQLAEDDRYQFQWWALSLMRASRSAASRGARPAKRAATKGWTASSPSSTTTPASPSARSSRSRAGTSTPGTSRPHRPGGAGKGRAGPFHHPEPPTAPMETAAVTAGYYHSPGWNQDYRRIQILTIEAC